ncbi:MAG: DNA translocase FtsK 4TM domain-containing protein, partial [Bryobacteraceae bacterium]
MLLGGLGLALSLASYSPLDPSWNTATGVARPSNLMGRFGAHFADLALQGLGISAYLMPAFIWLLGWKWVRSSELKSPGIK